MRKYYKGQYLICFYDKNDEYIRYVFDNVREILEFQGKEICRKNVWEINRSLFEALKRESHFTKLLTGEPMRVYIIDIDDNE